MWPNPQETADLVTLTEEILNGKRQFLCSGLSSKAEYQWNFLVKNPFANPFRSVTHEVAIFKKFLNLCLQVLKAAVGQMAAVAKGDVTAEDVERAK